MDTQTTQSCIPSLADEFALAELGNRTRSQRLCSIAEAISRSPALSFPQIFPQLADLRGFYRFVNNPHFDYLDIIEPHLLQTTERIVQAQQAVVIHDTTEVSFHSPTPRKGMGRLRKGGQGFLSHLSLAMAPESVARPLGLLGLRCWTRQGPANNRRAGKKRNGNDYAKQPDKESLRWGEAVEEVRARVGQRAQVLHVMDREADSYTLLSQMTQAQDRFVVRLKHDRVVGAEVVVGVRDRLRDTLTYAPVVAEREVPLSGRGPSSIPGVKRAHPERSPRVAKLQIQACPVVLQRPGYLGSEWLPCLPLNVVYVTELDVAEGEEGVEWILLTSEPIDTPEQVLQVVDWYRLRWPIEEYIKALKTGCALEERQGESYETMTKELAILAPIAWQLLLLRSLARSQPQTPATQVLTPTQIEVLQVAQSRVAVGERPTVREALLAVAALGGHLKSNGEPGWLVLWRGMEKLLTLELGWSLARSAAKP